MELIDRYTTLWNDVLEKYTDPRTADWFMMSSITPSAVICIAYVILVCLSPRFMKNREAMDLKNVLLVYNFLMVILSGYLFYEFAAAGWFTGYSLSCQPVDFSTSPKAMRMASVCWVFYISKFIELLDTVFFILRKKFNQVTVLHVFHHGIMPVSWWFGVKFAPGGFGTFHALLNSFIHFLMYTYYGLAACGPRFQKFLWWKKYMTQMQLIQFIMALVHASQLLFIKCNYPTLFAYWIMSYAIIFFIFFINFFIQEYHLKRNQKYKKQHHHHHHHHGKTNGSDVNGNGNGVRLDENGNHKAKEN